MNENKIWIKQFTSTLTLAGGPLQNKTKMHDREIRITKSLASQASRLRQTP